MRMRYILAFLIFCIVSPGDVSGKLSIGRISSFFGSYTHEVVIEREYPFTSPGTLTITNITGNIYVQTEWRSSIAVTVTKQCKTSDNLEKVTVEKYQTEKNNQTDLSIATTYTDEPVDSITHYTVQVPTHIDLKLKTERGNIYVSDAHGSITAQTHTGDVEIERIAGPVFAQVRDAGTIKLNRIYGSIKATTKKGDVLIENGSQSIIATSQNGNVTAQMHKLPDNARIALHTPGGGKATLKLPAAINAHVIGNAQQSTIASDHYIAIRPITSQIEKETRAYCNELARRICSCDRNAAEQREKTTQVVQKKVKQVLAQTAKYFYPFRWFSSKTDT